MAGGSNAPARRQGSVEDGRLKGASPRPEKRADIAKNSAPMQLALPAYPSPASGKGKPRVLSARPRESGGPEPPARSQELDSRLRGNERSKAHSSPSTRASSPVFLGP